MGKIKKIDNDDNDRLNHVDNISSKIKKLNNEDNPHSEGYDKNYKRRVWKLNYPKYLMGQSYANFLSIINNPITKDNYKMKLFYMCEKLDMTTDELYRYSDELTSKTKKKTIELENKLRDVINNFKTKNSLKEYDPHSGVIHLEYYAFKRFCEANRINLNFKWLKMLLPKINNKGKDKGYTKPQITNMLKVADFRSRLIILIFATSSMREGALAKLRVQDIIALPEGAEEDSIEGAKVIIYRGDIDEDVEFITPECYQALIAYLNARRELGENITPSSPIILKRIPRDRQKGWTVTKCISSSTIGNILVNVAVRAGLRKLSSDYIHSVRYTNKITTGFRKFCETTMIGARNKDGTPKMNPYIADRLLSHKQRGGIMMTKHYDESDIFEDYKRVIPDLTFSKEAEYKAKFDDATGKLEGVEQAKTYIKQKEKEMNERLAQMEEERKEDRIRIERERKEDIERLISLIAKESIVGKPAVPKSQIDLIRSGELEAIPLSISNRQGEDTKDFVIHNDIESIKNNPIKNKLSKSQTKNKLYNLEDPPTAFNSAQSKKRRK